MAVSDASSEGFTAVPVKVSSRSAVVTGGKSYRPACHAPFVSLFLDQHGGVRACCQNAHYPLGYVTERPLSEIWRGVRAHRLRRALEGHDFGFGCEFCAWQVDDGHPERAYARWYDDLPVHGPEPDWPQMLELSLSNTCNLQCVMCNGDWSSSIRAHREHRPPLEPVYDDAFFEDLRAFVPHLRRVNLLGGEPFLASETLRVIDLLIEADSNAKVSVTTNGTQWSPRVERMLDRLPIDVTVSVDGATRETYQSVRKGADWDELQANLDRFQARAAANGTSVFLVSCLMTLNWREFGDLCRLAARRGLELSVNTVTHPAEMSLLRLPLDDLDAVISGLEGQAGEGGFGQNVEVFEAEVDRLRRHRQSLLAGVTLEMIEKRDSDPSDLRNGAIVAVRDPAVRSTLTSPENPERQVELPAVTATEPEWVEQRIRSIIETELSGALSWLDVDADHHIEAIGGSQLPGGIDADVLRGHTVNELYEVLLPHLGALERLEEGPAETVRFERAGRELVRLEWNLQRFSAVLVDGRVISTLSAPRLDDRGRPVGTRLYLALG